MICLLPGCESRTGNKEKGQNITSFHRFPSLSSPVRQKWVEFVNRSQVGNWTLRKCHRLCSKHFSLDSFIVSNNNRVYLKDTAVPTIMFSSHIKKIVRTHSRNVRAVPLLRCVDKSNLLPHPTQTPASRCNTDGVVVPSTHPVNNPKLLLRATPTTASRCNPDGVVVL
ncbi:peroxynitrite isomerase THAP4-like [Choristoneura fumiferana]|uniref:peroxynitrite isomerase THAP4-like n=1 Tax=Choristoneura fumiferana TaxID=7141 RepID=UPI003D15CFC4